MDIENMSIEEAKKLANELNWSYFDMAEDAGEEYTRAVQVVLLELEKKDKVINEMAEMINNHDIDEDVCKQMGKDKHCNDYVTSETNCISCIKEYFTNKVEDDE